MQNLSDKNVCDDGYNLSDLDAPVNIGLSRSDARLAHSFNALNYDIDQLF